jgi:hypothetical protein
VSDVAEIIPAPTNDFQLFAFHRNISSAFSKRSFIKIDLALRRLDALRRFPLERVDNPDFLGKLHRVDDAERIAPERQRNLEHPGRHPAHRFRNVGLAAFRRDRQRGQTYRPGPFRECLKFLQCRLDP